MPTDNASADLLQHELLTRVSLQATPQSNGEFEIVCISVGQGNGWNFSADVLKNSVPLWNAIESFVDHMGWLEDHHSIRDLCGVVHSAEWDETQQGVRAKLRAIGPSGPLLIELGREVLNDHTAQPRIGFSADIGFTASGHDVKQILRVFTLDLVFDPARGGAFLRAINHVLHPLPAGAGAHYAAASGQPERSIIMADEQQTPAPATPQAAPNPDVEAVRTLLQVHQQQQQIAAEAEAARQVRVQMCAYLLDAGLAGSKLPEAVTKRIKTQFVNRVFEPTELNQAIEDARTMVSELTGGLSVAGMTHARQMFNSDDQIQAAVDDLLNAPRDEATKNLKVHRLTGIRELYLGMTGDYDYHGGFYRERVRFATTADFTGLVMNALNKIVVNQWDLLGRAGYDWWMPITAKEHFTSLNSITGTLVGTVGQLPVITEGGEYGPLEIGDSPETASFVKYGGYIPLTLELIDRDETRKLAAYPRELANSALRRLSGLVAAIFTANSGIGPTMADTGALFNNTAVTTAGGHANLLTTALGTDFTAWNAVAAAMFKQPLLIKQATGYYGTGPRQAIKPKFCLVPIELGAQADSLFIPRFASPIDTIQSAGGETYGGHVVPVVVPEWTDATDWAAVADPVVAPAIYVGDRFGLLPEIFIAGDELSPAVFMNDEHRLKIRHFLAVWVNDFRPLHKENVSG